MVPAWNLRLGVLLPILLVTAPWCRATEFQPATNEPTAAAPAAPQSLEESGWAESASAARREIVKRLAREAGGKAASAPGKTATSQQSRSIATQSAPPPTPATQEARPKASSAPAAESEPGLTGANTTLLAVLVAVGGVTAVAIGTRKRWRRQTTRKPHRFAVYRVMATGSSVFVGNHHTAEGAKHAAACRQACAPEGISYVVDPPRPAGRTETSGSHTSVWEDVVPDTQLRLKAAPQQRRPRRKVRGSGTPRS